MIVTPYIKHFHVVAFLLLLVSCMDTAQERQCLERAYANALQMNIEFEKGIPEINPECKIVILDQLLPINDWRFKEILEFISNEEDSCKFLAKTNFDFKLIWLKPSLMSSQCELRIVNNFSEYDQDEDKVIYLFSMPYLNKDDGIGFIWYAEFRTPLSGGDGFYLLKYDSNCWKVEKKIGIGVY